MVRKQKARKASTPKVLILVEGGLISEILSEDTGIDVLVIDKDSRDCSVVPAFVTWHNVSDIKSMKDTLDEIKCEFEKEMKDAPGNEELDECNKFYETLTCFMGHLKNKTTIG